MKNCLECASPATKKTLSKLDEHTVLGLAAVVNIWDALVTFNTYLRARDDATFDQSLRQFVTHQKDHSHRAQIGKIVWTEGETVKSND